MVEGASASKLRVEAKALQIHIEQRRSKGNVPSRPGWARVAGEDDQIVTDVPSGTNALASLSGRISPIELRFQHFPANPKLHRDSSTHGFDVYVVVPPVPGKDDLTRISGLLEECNVGIVLLLTGLCVMAARP